MEQHGTTIISFSQPGGSTHLLPLLLLENLGPLSLGSSELFCFSREWKRWLGCNKSAKMVSKSLYGFPSSEAPTTSSCALCKAWQATQMQTICHFAVPLGRINHRNHENEAPTHRDTPVLQKPYSAFNSCFRCSISCCCSCQDLFILFKCDFNIFNSSRPSTQSYSPAIQIIQDFNRFHLWNRPK